MIRIAPKRYRPPCAVVHSPAPGTARPTQTGFHVDRRERRAARPVSPTCSSSVLQPSTRRTYTTSLSHGVTRNMIGDEWRPSSPQSWRLMATEASQSRELASSQDRRRSCFLRPEQSLPRTLQKEQALPVTRLIAFSLIWSSRSSVRFVAAPAAPPKPHLGHRAGGAGSLSALRARD